MIFNMSAPDPKAHVTVANTSTTVLAANRDRTHAIIKASADNTEAIFLGFTAAAVVDEGFSLDPGDSFQIGAMNYTHEKITAISASGGQIAEPFEA